MTNFLLRLLDLWSRRYAGDKLSQAPTPTQPATVITGASEGIGLAIARRFAEAEHKVVLVARRGDLLEQAAAGIKRDFNSEAVVLVVDINRADAVQTIDLVMKSRGLHVDILVNNAGFGLSGLFAEMPADEIDALLACNIAALTRLSHHFLPGMLARRTGGLINVASLAGLTPGPYQAAYYASKAYVISLTRAIGYELRGRGVRVLMIAPGPVATRFHARMRAETSYYRLLVPSPTPQHVAAATYQGFRWHRRFIVPGMPAKILSLTLRLVPFYVSMPIVAWMLAPREQGTTTDV